MLKISKDKIIHHLGTFQHADVINQAYNFNNPIQVFSDVLKGNVFN